MEYNIEDKEDRVSLNVGGILFETKFSTLQKIPKSRLANLVLLGKPGNLSFSGGSDFAQAVSNESNFSARGRGRNGRVPSRHSSFEKDFHPLAGNSCSSRYSSHGFRLQHETCEKAHDVQFRQFRIPGDQHFLNAAEKGFRAKGRFGDSQHFNNSSLSNQTIWCVELDHPLEASFKMDELNDSQMSSNYPQKQQTCKSYNTACNDSSTDRSCRHQAMRAHQEKIPYSPDVGRHLDNHADYSVQPNVCFKPSQPSRQKKFFFDRSAEVFPYILNAYRTGELHLPRNICSISLREELQYWRIPEDLIHECCWSAYSEGLQNSHVISLFEKKLYDVYKSADMRDTLGCLGKIWLHMEKPYHNAISRLWSVIYFIFMIIACITFTFESVAYFKVLKPEYVPLYQKRIAQNRTVYNTDYMTWAELKYPYRYVEISASIFFASELIIRFITCPRKREFVCSGYNLLDFVLVVLVWSRYIFAYTVANEADNYNKLSQGIVVILTCSLELQFLRVFRLAKLVPGLRVIYYFLKAGCKELCLLMVVTSMFVLLSGTLMFCVENVPSNQSKLDNVPKAIWWALITMTTVGYGDFVPKTTLGYFVGALCAMAGVILLAMPVAIMTRNFSMYYDGLNSQSQRKRRKQYLKQINEQFYGLEKNDSRDTDSGPIGTNGSPEIQKHGSTESVNDNIDTDNRKGSNIGYFEHVISATYTPQDDNRCISSNQEKYELSETGTTQQNDEVESKDSYYPLMLSATFSPQLGSRCVPSKLETRKHPTTGPAMDHVDKSKVCQCQKSHKAYGIPECARISKRGKIVQTQTNPTKGNINQSKDVNIKKSQNFKGLQKSTDSNDKTGHSAAYEGLGFVHSDTITRGGTLKQETSVQSKSGPAAGHYAHQHKGAHSQKSQTGRDIIRCATSTGQQDKVAKSKVNLRGYGHQNKYWLSKISKNLCCSKQC